MEPFILFELSDTTYGVRSRFVQQIEMIDDVASVPNAHPAVEGVVLVRGQVIPALNLRTRFGFEKIERDLRSRLVVINTEERVVGLVVDTAREFLKISPESIEPPPEALTGLSGHYLEGIATIGERMILILNLDAVLDLDYEVGTQITQMNTDLMTDGR
ncbi:MAG TPA: chemotaxis protein CheW [Pyrinomonadaceae bacterium]|jgi:purine-binding chemotaxis protein CheW|nr:chemotaxis protein CheW [Pyrinomonadaceae bacterium]